MYIYKIASVQRFGIGSEESIHRICLGHDNVESIRENGALDGEGSPNQLRQPIHSLLDPEHIRIDNPWLLFVDGLIAHRFGRMHIEAIPCPHL